MKDQSGWMTRRKSEFTLPVSSFIREGLFPGSGFVIGIHLENDGLTDVRDGLVVQDITLGQDQAKLLDGDRLEVSGDLRFLLGEHDFDALLFRDLGDGGGDLVEQGED